MKQLFSLLLAAVVAAPLFGAVNPKQAAMWKSKLATAKDPAYRAALSCNLYYSENEDPKTYAGLKSKITEIYRENGVDKPRDIQYRTFFMACEWFGGKFAKDAFSESKNKMDVFWTAKIAMMHCKQLGLNGEQVMAEVEPAFECVCNHDCYKMKDLCDTLNQRFLTNPSTREAVKKLYKDNAAALKKEIAKKPAIWTKTLATLKANGIEL